MLGYAGSFVYFHGHPIYEGSEGTICLVCGETLEGNIWSHIDGCSSSPLTPNHATLWGADWEWVEEISGPLLVDLSPERKKLLRELREEWEHLWKYENEQNPELDARWKEKNLILAHPYAQEYHGTPESSALWAFNQWRWEFRNQAEKCFHLALHDKALPEVLREMIRAWFGWTEIDSSL